MSKQDFTFADHGSIIIATPMTAEASAWLEATAPEDAQWWATGIVIEPRYVEGFEEAANDAGFSTR